MSRERCALECGGETPVHLAVLRTLCGVLLLAMSVQAASSAIARGGEGGYVIRVTRLDDNVRKPQPGSLRWAVMQKGPRVVRFAVAGNITLRDRIVVREPRLTIDGSDAPALGVCVRGGALEFRDTHDVIVRHIRVRLGDAPGLRGTRLPFRWRPEGSTGLDCINLHQCERVLIEHCSLSWSCDEIVSVVRCQDVTVRWCILSEPLGLWRLHPYGDHHAFCFNASASTLSVRHCLFAHYVMRGPQFEAEDTLPGDGWPVRMEAAGNVMFDFKRSGSRYSAGVEKDADIAAGRRFEFQFIANRYIGAMGSRGAIEVITKHGALRSVSAGVARCVTDAGPMVVLESGGALEKADAVTRRQVRGAALFGSEMRDAPDVAELVSQAGCHVARDEVDARIIADVLHGVSRPTIQSPEQVGGWPPLDGRGRKGTPSLAHSLFRTGR